MGGMVKANEGSATYFALVHRAVNSDFDISFPDLPGVVGASRTLDVAYGRAEKALAAHLEGLNADGLPVPSPSTLEEIVAELEEKGDGLDGQYVVNSVQIAVKRRGAIRH
jgi:predicted RNase H-like HicB family nuclease